MSVTESRHPGRWWHMLEDGRMQCDLCPRDCRLHEGQRGLCFVRMRKGEQMLLTTYGRSSGFCVDPIEKKPLNQFYPGSSVLSFGTAGCNLACKFCQNWDISKSRDMDSLADAASPEVIAQAAQRLGCRSVAFTYNDPVIFAEYAMDVADACHAVDVQTVAVTAGYMHDAPRREFYAKIDAANIDLKAFTETFYSKVTLTHLQPVLDVLKWLRHETGVWFEITNLIIPTLNDDDSEFKQLCDWVLENLGDDVPLHFTAFHPDFKLQDKPPTPPETLHRARRMAMQMGLKYVYEGNIYSDGGNTICPGCKQVVITRSWHSVTANKLKDGCCAKCGTRSAGVFTKAEAGKRREWVSAAAAG